MNKLLSFILISVCTIAAVANTGTRGGGDICEDRIKSIRDDLKSWIDAGGPAGLTLLAPITTASYSQSMEQQIGLARIQCVGAGDVGFPVQINGTAKVCRFDATAQTSNITCDYDKFLALSENDQYVLVHHEFAGLANIEPPNGDDSQYGISNQISGFLTEIVEKRLAVKQSPAPSPATRNCNLTDAQKAEATQAAINAIYQAITTKMGAIAGLTLAQNPEAKANVYFVTSVNNEPYGGVRNFNFVLADQTPVSLGLSASNDSSGASFSGRIGYDAEQNISQCTLYFDAYAGTITNVLTGRPISSMNVYLTSDFYTYGPNN